MKPYLQNRRTFVAAGMSAAGGLALKPALGQSQDLAGLTLKKASELLRSKAASPLDLTQACLKRIDQYNPSLNAFITVTRAEALATAREMEAEQRRVERRGPPPRVLHPPQGHTRTPRL